MPITDLFASDPRPEQAARAQLASHISRAAAPYERLEPLCRHAALAVSALLLGTGRDRQGDLVGRLGLLLPIHQSLK